MGKAENGKKSQAYAEYMKEHGVRRTTGKCPLGCGYGYKINIRGEGSGQELINHLGKCRGGAASKRRLSRGRKAPRR
jgi:hypothetical protein